MSGLRLAALLGLLSIAGPLGAQATPPDAAKAFGARGIATPRGGPITAAEVAKAFGARENVVGISLSPDGQRVAYVSPDTGQGATGYVLAVAPGSKANPFISVDGNPERISHCSWVSNERLACQAYHLAADPTLGTVPHTRVLAVNADGSNVRELSLRKGFYTRGRQMGGGLIIDLLPGEDSAVLMARNYLPDDHLGSHFGSDRTGLGVDWIDTRDLRVKHVEWPRRGAIDYITDSHGVVRIFATKVQEVGFDTTVVTYNYRTADSPDWHKLSDFDYSDNSGFAPLAVDPTLNVAYGFQKKDGRLALYSVALDGSLRQQLIYAHPDVDVDELVQIGRQKHVVGVAFATDIRHVVYFDPEVEGLIDSLHKALPQSPLIHVVDSSADEKRLLIFASSDSDPGVYYLYDRPTHRLQTFLVARNALEGMRLASVRPITYPAGDGTAIPAYLTLPPGREDAKGLPAIVLPHGGPSARDEWGFDWLSQFYAARGFAVLQPEFRGSAGYGDAWFQQNGFRSWRIAISDVLDAGRYLVKQGIADPQKLAVVGWSYGGYAALESAIVDPSMFKAVVAVAPVTDLTALREEHRRWSDYAVVSEFVGDGPHVHEGSPAEHADRIKVPVLLFHGALDHNVSVNESRLMAERLRDAGAQVELVTWNNLDHYMEDSDARAQLLDKSDTFLRKALGL
jgi:dipeptidyl aminopeptidase/acylaminoacyl peptidase